MIRKRKRVSVIAGSAALAALIMLIIWIAWGNSALMVSEVTVTDSKIPSGFSGFRIAQVSDLHNAEFGENNKKLIDMLNGANPDVIVITGDFADSRRTDIKACTAFAEQAALIAPTYYVTGNHEARISQYEELEAGISAAGVTVLRNESLCLERNGDCITLAGADDPDFQPDCAQLGAEAGMRSALSDLIDGGDTYTVLLAHRPELFGVYAECGADLVFAGHAHGGQFRLPFIGGLAAPGQGLFPEYDSGLYTKDGAHMIVSRGIGNSIIPFRVNNRPEIVVAELKNQ